MFTEAFEVLPLPLPLLAALPDNSSAETISKASSRAAAEEAATQVKSRNIHFKLDFLLVRYLQNCINMWGESEVLLGGAGCCTLEKLLRALARNRVRIKSIPPGEGMQTWFEDPMTHAFL